MQTFDTIAEIVASLTAGQAVWVNADGRSGIVYQSAEDMEDDAGHGIIGGAHQFEVAEDGDLTTALIMAGFDYEVA